MADFFHSLSAQVLNMATVVQPLHPLRFASMPEMNLPSPVELRQRPVVAGPGTEEQDPLGFRASRLPAPLVHLADSTADLPIPSFRQMGQAGTTNRIHARQSSLPFPADDTVDLDQVEAAAPPAGLLGNASVLDRAAHAFAAPAAAAVAASNPNGLATADPRLHDDPSSPPALASLPTAAPAVESTAGLMGHQPAADVTTGPTREPLTKLAAASRHEPSPNHPAATALTDTGHALETQVTPVVDKTTALSTQPVELEPGSATFAEPSTPSAPAARQSARAVRTSPVGQTAVEAVPAIQQLLAPVDMAPDSPLTTLAARPVDALPGHPVAQEPVVRATRPLTTELAPVLAEAPIRLPASAARQAAELVAAELVTDEPFAARPVAEQALESTPRSPASTRLAQADPQPLAAPAPATMANRMDPPQVMPVSGETRAATRSTASGIPAHSPERVATPAILADTVSLPARIDPQLEPDMPAPPVGTFAPETQALPSLLTQPALSASLTPSARADEPQIMPVLRDGAPTFAPSTEPEIAPEGLAEPAATVLSAGRPSDQSAIKPVSIEPASIEPATASEPAVVSALGRQPAVVPPPLNREGPTMHPADASQVKPVMHPTNPVAARSTEPAPSQVFPAESASPTTPAGRPVTVVAPVSALDEQVTDKGALGAFTAETPVTPATFIPAAPEAPSVAEPKVLPVLHDLGAVVPQPSDLGFTGAHAAEPTSVIATSSRPLDVALPSLPVGEQNLANVAPVSPGSTVRITNAPARAESSVLPVVRDARGVTTGAVDPESTQAPLADPTIKVAPVVRQVSPALRVPPAEEMGASGEPVLPTKSLPGGVQPSMAAPDADIVELPSITVHPLPQPASVMPLVLPALDPLSPATPAPVTANLSPATLSTVVATTATETIQRKASTDAGVRPLRMDIPQPAPVALPSPPIVAQAGPAATGAPQVDLLAAEMLSPPAHQITPPIGDATLARTRSAEIAGIEIGGRVAQGMVRPVVTPTPVQVTTSRSPFQAADGATGQPAVSTGGAHELPMAPFSATAVEQGRQESRERKLAPISSAPALADTRRDVLAAPSPAVHGAPSAGEPAPATRVSEQFVGAPRTPGAMIRPRSEPFAPAQPPKAPAIPPPLPTIRVTIGRVEVRTTPEAPKPATQRRQPAPAALSLDAYLKRGQREAR